MRCKQYIKKCGEFSVCSEVGEANVLFTEHADDRTTLYQIIVKGSGRVAKPFSSEYKPADTNEHRFINMKEYIGHHTIFESYEPFLIYGFNTLDLKVDWDGKLVSESFEGNTRSYLICFDGRPIINGTELRRLDYAKLENKWYDIDIKDGVVGVFTKL